MLDDFNTFKFREIVKGLSKSTQFIIITHNKETMQIAHKIYGVTIDQEKKGVSYIVPLDLNKFKNMVQHSEREFAEKKLDSLKDTLQYF